MTIKTFHLELLTLMNCVSSKG